MDHITLKIVDGEKFVPLGYYEALDLELKEKLSDLAVATKALKRAGFEKKNKDWRPPLGKNPFESPVYKKLQEDYDGLIDEFRKVMDVLWEHVVQPTDGLYWDAYSEVFHRVMSEVDRLRGRGDRVDNELKETKWALDKAQKDIEAMEQDQEDLEDARNHWEKSYESLLEEHKELHNDKLPKLEHKISELNEKLERKRSEMVSLQLSRNHYRNQFQFLTETTVPASELDLHLEMIQQQKDEIEKLKKRLEDYDKGSREALGIE